MFQGNINNISLGIKLIIFAQQENNRQFETNKVKTNVRQQTNNPHRLANNPQTKPNKKPQNLTTIKPRHRVPRPKPAPPNNNINPAPNNKLIEIIGVDFYVFVGDICFFLFRLFALLGCIVWFGSGLGVVGFFRQLKAAAVSGGEVGEV